MSDDKIIPINSYSEITFTRATETPLNPWELSTFITEFSNHIYKFDLLRNIALLVKQGHKAENIIILDGSFKRKYLRHHIIDLTNEAQFESFQSIGIPVSLFPNESILKLGLIIDFYRSANVLLRRNLTSEILTLAYGQIDNTDFDKIIDSLYNKAIAKGTKQRNFEQLKSSWIVNT